MVMVMVMVCNSYRMGQSSYIFVSLFSELLGSLS